MFNHHQFVSGRRRSQLAGSHDKARARSNNGPKAWDGMYIVESHQDPPSHARFRDTNVRFDTGQGG